MISFVIFDFKLLIYYLVAFLIVITRKEISIIYHCFSCNHIFYEIDTVKSTHHRTIRLCSKYVVYHDWFLNLFNTSWGICLILKESNYTAVFLSINNETQRVPLLFLSSKFMTYVPSFTLSKLLLEKCH